MASLNSTTSVDLRDFNRAIDTYAVRTNRGFNDAFKRAMAGVARRAQAITPPASNNSARANANGTAGRPKLTQTDKKRGETSLQADLMAIFSGTQTNGTRKSKAASEADIERIHDRIFARKVPKKTLRSDKPDGTKYDVDAMALKRFEAKLKKNVGFLAAGFNAGLKIFGITPPAWVGNKAGKGTAQAQLTGLRRRVVITHEDVPDKLHGELQRRVNWATRAQMKAMEREIRAVAGKTNK